MTTRVRLGGATCGAGPGGRTAIHGPAMSASFVRPRRLTIHRIAANNYQLPERGRLDGGTILLMRMYVTMLP